MLKLKRIFHQNCN